MILQGVYTALATPFRNGKVDYQAFEALLERQIAGKVATANSNKIRNAQGDAAQQQEKDLNTAANVLAIGTTAASATATVFNATQINAIKKVAAVAEKCTGVLK